MKTYQYLNLEQKMAKIRKKMPSLLKKFHNDEADYDFATLDDIYESMTPALNKYGVNFDIVGEKPTQYENEKPVYLTQDADGFWRYESDLEICWTNIDNPKEERHTVIHILGTHEIPDKARGTAMTYGLKYYFRNKFCMRQIDSVEDDPDGMEYGMEKAHTESKGHSSKSEKSGRTESGKPKLEKPDRNEEKKSVESKETKLSGNRCSGSKEAGKTKQAGKSIPEEKRTGMPVEERSGSSGERKGSNISKVPADSKKKGEKEQQKPADASDHPAGKEEIEQAGQAKSVVQESVGTQLAVQKMSARQQTTCQKETEGQQAVSQKEAAGLQAASQKEISGQPIAKQQETISKQAEDTEDGFQAAGEENVPFEDAGFMEQLEQELETEKQGADTSLEKAKNFICPFGLHAGKTLGEVFNLGMKGQETVKWIAYRYQGPAQDLINAARLVVENPDAVIEPVTNQQAA